MEYATTLDSNDLFEKLKSLFKIEEDNITLLELEIDKDEIVVFIKYYGDEYLDSRLYRFKYDDREKSWKFLEAVSEILGFPIDETMYVTIEFSAGSFVYVGIQKYIEKRNLEVFMNELEKLYEE